MRSSVILSFTIYAVSTPAIVGIRKAARRSFIDRSPFNTPRRSQPVAHAGIRKAARRLLIARSISNMPRVSPDFFIIYVTERTMQRLFFRELYNPISFYSKAMREGNLEKLFSGIHDWIQSPRLAIFN